MRIPFILLTLLFLSGCFKSENIPEGPVIKPLNVYTWSNYFDEEAIQRFERENNIKVKFSYFSSNEELLAKLQAGARGYDVIVPSGYVVRAMKSLALLLPLNAKMWLETKNLSAPFKSPEFDKNLEYTIPLSWGVTGIAVNTDKVKEKIDSWEALFAIGYKYKGQITMLDDSSEVIGAGLKFLSFSANEKSEEALEKVKELLKRQKRGLKSYTSETIPLLKSGDIALAQAYSSDVGQVRLTHPNISFVIPKEGGVKWVDTLAIPKGAEAIDEAIKFIKYFLKPETAILQIKHLKVNPVVDLGGNSKELQILKEEGLFPAPEILKGFEYSNDEPGHAEKLNSIWTELRAD